MAAKPQRSDRKSKKGKVSAAQSASDPRDLDRNLSYLLHDVARLRSAAFDQMMRKHGITRAQWRVLAFLYREDGPTQAELAERLSLGRVSLGGIVDRLEVAGWVRREQDTKDRRANRIWLTDQVRGVQKRMQAGVDSLNNVSLRGLSERQIADLIDTLFIIKRNLLETESARKTRAR
ncbi:MAG: MarR family winged helix-turn-helix transcriptional regulator [Methyloligellaceae bacterium]